MNAKGNKRGDLTSTQIILLVLAIIGFGMVLLALYLVNLGGYSDEEICKLSVLTRATAPSEAQAAVPLKCKTSKICITDRYFGGCEEQFAGVDDVEYVRLSGDAANQKRIIEETSANAMYDCWSMMGEGKLDIFRRFFGQESAKCVVCSRVAIEPKFVTDNPEVMRSIDVDSYLKSHQVPGQSRTYLQAFTDKGVNSYSSFNESAFNAVVAKGEGFSTDSYSYNGNSNYDVAFVFSQIRSEKIGDVLSKMAMIGGAAGAATFVSPAGKLASKLVFTPTGIVVVSAAVAGGVGYGTYRAYEGQKASALYCEKFVAEGSSEGCSIVQAVPYNFEDVNKICGAIEGEL